MVRATLADLKPYINIWEDSDRRQAVITRVDDRLVEYGFAAQDSVYYLEKDAFLRTFSKVDTPKELTTRERKQLMDQLESTLVSLKTKGLGDQVYAIMEEMGL
jgi:hypothetical protein